MTKNVGGIDKTLRIIAGAGLVAWAALLGGPVWAYIGIVPLATGLMSWCPVYIPLKINSAK